MNDILAIYRVGGAVFTLSHTFTDTPKYQVHVNETLLMSSHEFAMMESFYYETLQDYAADEIQPTRIFVNY